MPSEKEKEEFKNARVVSLEEDRTIPVAVYYVFTPHKEFNEECINDIWVPLLEALEKVYFSRLIRLNVSKLKKKDIIETFDKIRKTIEYDAYASVEKLKEVWNEEHPKILSIIGGDLEDSWKWHIEIRLDNTTDSSHSSKFKKLDKEK